MTNQPLSRRGFAGVLGAAMGAAIFESTFAAGAAPNVPATAAGGPVRLNANENPYGPSPRASRAIAQSVRSASRYPDDLARDLRDSLSRHHGVAPEQVVLGCGSSQILQMADLAYLGPGRKIVASEPTFEAVLAYAVPMRAEAVKVPQTADFRHDLARMAAACDEQTGLAYVCNPNNPTGTIVGADELADFVSKVPASAIVLVDEAYHHFVEDRRYRTSVELLARHPNLIVARTFSKIYGLAGMRLGYAVASPRAAKELSERASWDNVNAAVLSAGLACLSDPNIVTDCRRKMNETRRWLCAELERDGRRYIPSHANFVMIDVGGEVAPVIHAFRSRNMEVGRKFPSMPNWLRISIGKPEEMRAFVAGLREIVPAKQKAA
ncbi:MAG: histidinol-phosphate transaminase [Thermoanaerobaculia bacterium]